MEKDNGLMINPNIDKEAFLRDLKRLKKKGDAWDEAIKKNGNEGYRKNKKEIDDAMTALAKFIGKTFVLKNQSSTNQYTTYKNGKRKLTPLIDFKPPQKKTK
jgi:gas vesicle protein